MSTCRRGCTQVPRFLRALSSQHPCLLAFVCRSVRVARSCHAFCYVLLIFSMLQCQLDCQVLRVVQCEREPSVLVALSAELRFACPQFALQRYLCLGAWGIDVFSV
ncbi:hypothetical protein TRVL_05457 [Trypanosoma vivax]|nr:hypothetical protein TRVL_05457 [Trypanosoma vivax]